MKKHVSSLIEVIGTAVVLVGFIYGAYRFILDLGIL